MEGAMQNPGWRCGHVFNTVWKDHEVGKRIEEMNGSLVVGAEWAQRGMLKIKMEVDHAGYLQGVVRLKCLQGVSIYLWKTRRSSEFYYNYNGTLLKGFMLGNIMTQFMWQEDYSWEEGQVLMLTIFGWKQTRWKGVDGLQAYWEGRMEDILVNWVYKL